MAVAVWRGPGGTSSQPHSGDFNDASNWSGGAVPDGSTSAVLGAGKYNVTFSNHALTIESLDVGAKVNLTLLGETNTLTDLDLKGDSSNAGRVALLGSALIMDDGVSLVNFGEIYGGEGGGGINASVFGGTLINDGLVAASDGLSSSVLDLTSAIVNESDGVVNSGGGSRVTFAYQLDNRGLVSSVDGGLINFAGGGQTLNLADGVLTGGHWAAIGAGSTLNLYNSQISSLVGGAVVTLSGAGSQLGGESSGGLTQIESTLENISRGTELHILGGRDFTCGQNLDVGGLVELGGGVLTTDMLVVHDDPGATLRGYGAIDADVKLYGLLSADNHRGHQTLTLTGDNEFFGNLGGRGTLVLSGGLNVLETSSKVFVNDIIVDGHLTTLQLSQDLVYDGKLESSAIGAIDLDGHVLRLSGKVILDSGEIESGKLQLEGAQVTSTGFSLIDSELRNDGVVTVRAGELVDLHGVNGTGEFHVLNAGKLAFASVVSSGQTVFMDGSAASLIIGTDAGFKGTVSGYGAGDTLNFETVDASGATVSWKSDAAGGGTLTLVNGAERASIHLDGSYQKSMFHLAASGDDGTDVTYGAASGADHAASHWDAHGGLAI